MSARFFVDFPHNQLLNLCFCYMFIRFDGKVCIYMLGGYEDQNVPILWVGVYFLPILLTEKW